METGFGLFETGFEVGEELGERGDLGLGGKVEVGDFLELLTEELLVVGGLGIV